MNDAPLQNLTHYPPLVAVRPTYLTPRFLAAPAIHYSRSTTSSDYVLSISIAIARLLRLGPLFISNRWAHNRVMLRVDHSDIDIYPPSTAAGFFRASQFLEWYKSRATTPTEENCDLVLILVMSHLIEKEVVVNLGHLANDRHEFAHPDISLLCNR
ncbi:hypothetical protein GSI_03457 [Ganoderma sinense ZZ0214-1]|uniref:Uncharacterized protein n=1 Tax=Ganoderma sinense ZZ0214-1 TaxID=1077348 RepID=A0A2G8SLM5_9APHY|nr:hypothetical protein GSI_03457 [Ganoderma sinense ZZ0214-1]